MSFIDKLSQGVARVFTMIAQGQEVQAAAPRNLDLEFEQLARTLPLQGPHKKRKKGDGMELFSVDPYQRGDNLRRVSRRYSEKDRQGRTMVVHQEAEVRHHYYMWQDNSASMDYKSAKASHSPREISGAIITGMAAHLGKLNAKVGLLENGQWTQGARSGAWMAGRINDDDNPHDIPQVQKRLARDSSALLFSDCLWDLDQPEPPIAAHLDELAAQGISGWLVMVLDPESVDFAAKGHRLFEGMEGEDSFERDNISAQEYQAVLIDHVKKLDDLTKAHGFKLIICRTDEPLTRVVDALYDLGPALPARWPQANSAQPSQPSTVRPA